MEYGQRAFVGKVNMDQESPDFYREDTQQSIRDTRRYTSATSIVEFIVIFEPYLFFLLYIISFIEFVREMKVNSTCVYVLNLAIDKVYTLTCAM